MSAGEAIKAGDFAREPTELRHLWKKGVRLTKTNKPRVKVNSTQEACRSVLCGAGLLRRLCTIKLSANLAPDRASETIRRRRSEQPKPSVPIQFRHEGES